MSEERLDILIFVGREFYRERQDYIEEAVEALSPTGEKGLGCCRRVPKIPLALKIGETQVHLVHRRGKAVDQPAMLFGSFLVDGVIQCSKIQAVQDEVRNGLPLTAIGAQGRAVMPDRGCGGIDPPALYLVGPRDVTLQLGLRPDTGRTGKIELIEPALSLGDLKHFRGFRQVTWGDLMAMVA